MQRLSSFKMRRCAIKDCISLTKSQKFRSTLKYFTFPKDPVRREQWMKATGRKITKKTPIVCSLHFADDDWRLKDRLLKSKLKDRQLNEKAVPILRLPPEVRTNRHWNTSSSSKVLVKEAFQEYDLRYGIGAKNRDSSSTCEDSFEESTMSATSNSDWDIEDDIPLKSIKGPQKAKDMDLSTEIESARQTVETYQDALDLLKPLEAYINQIGNQNALLRLLDVKNVVMQDIIKIES